MEHTLLNDGKVQGVIKDSSDWFEQVQITLIPRLRARLACSQMSGMEEGGMFRWYRANSTDAVTLLGSRRGTRRDGSAW